MRMRVVVVVVVVCLWSVAAASLARGDSCETYVHPQYGLGQCVDQGQCPNSLYVSGLCESQPSTMKCCFSLQPAREEFRAVWIATVANIDWPSDRKSVV